MKHVIITGANGFVGSNLVSVLIKQGWFVYALDLAFDNPACNTWDNGQVEFIQSGCINLPILSADALIHGAFITASPEARNESPEANLRANINPMLAMMEYAEANSITRSIYLSSSGVFKETLNELIVENKPQSPLGVYAVAKTMMEHLVGTMRTVYERDMVCVRLGNIFGQNEYQRPTRPYLSIIGRMLHMATTSGQIDVYHPDETREWTFVTDIGYAIHALLTANHLNHTLYHVASGYRLSNLDIAKQIQAVLSNIKINIQHESSPLTRLGTLDNTRLKQDTGFENWTSIEKGIQALGESYSYRSKANA